MVVRLMDEGSGGGGGRGCCCCVLVALSFSRLAVWPLKQQTHTHLKAPTTSPHVVSSVRNNDGEDELSRCDGVK